MLDLRGEVLGREVHLLGIECHRAFTLVVFGQQEEKVVREPFGPHFGLICALALCDVLQVGNFEYEGVEECLVHLVMEGVLHHLVALINEVEETLHGADVRTAWQLYSWGAACGGDDVGVDGGGHIEYLLQRYGHHPCFEIVREGNDLTQRVGRNEQNGALCGGIGATADDDLERPAGGEYDHKAVKEYVVGGVNVFIWV